MDNKSIYRDIAQRTQGDIYIGVVGPVRTGKSTLIKRFMETLVIPRIENVHNKERTIDELPQSAAGKTIMTTEPKFIPNEAVDITVNDNAHLKVRMIDCVGYIVPSALGYIEEEIPRMVRTPWFEDEVPFDVAAETGTRKVINDHSTLGLVVTTDGTIGELPREDYVDAEERVIKELKAINKPYIVLLNSQNPENPSTVDLSKMLEEKYKVTVMPISCLDLDEEKIRDILEKVLFEFPVRSLDVDLPSWIDALDDDYWLKKNLFGSIVDTASNLEKIREIKPAAAWLANNEFISGAKVTGMDLGNGSAKLEIAVDPNLFYRVLKETSGLDINDEGELISSVRDLAYAKKQYDKYFYAIKEAEAKGYGIVNPTIEELSLEEPEIMHQGGRYGVRLKASAPSLHIIRADIQTEVCPIVGSERQSEELVKYLLTEFEENPTKIWESNIFGKSLHELVNEGLQNKLGRMPEDAREKLQETLQRIINEGTGGLICILL